MVKIETITPKLAREMLETSYGNRPINQRAVLEYAVAMKTRKWSPTASCIVIDEQEKLIDGHHGLWAVTLAMMSVEMSVRHDAPTTDRELIDTGRKRSLNDLTTMYTGRQNVNLYNAALNIAAGLVVHSTFSRPKLNTLDTARKWAGLFREGLEYVVSEVVKAQSGHLNSFRNGYVSGAFVFAYKRNPSQVKTFMKACISGESIDSKMPVYTVRNLILNAKGRQAGGGGIPVVTIKILSGLYAHIKGEQYRTAQAGREGWDYFRQAYESAQVENLLTPYLELTTGREETMREMREAIRARAT